MLDHYLTWPTGLAVVATVLLFATPIIQGRRSMLVTAAFGLAFMIGHFILLQEYTAAAIMAVSTVRNLHAIWVPSNKLVVPYALLATTALLCAQHGFDLLPLIATWLAGIAVFQKRASHLRAWLAASEATYLVFAFSIADWAFAVQSGGLLLMCLLGHKLERRAASVSRISA